MAPLSAELERLKTESITLALEVERAAKRVDALTISLKSIAVEYAAKESRIHDIQSQSKLATEEATKAKNLLEKLRK